MPARMFIRQIGSQSSLCDLFLNREGDTVGDATRTVCIVTPLVSGASRAFSVLYSDTDGVSCRRPEIRKIGA